MARIHNWISNLIKNMDEGLNEKEKREVLENTGRKCITTSMIKKAKKLFSESQNLEEFLKEYTKINSHFQEVKGEYFMVYPHCYCSFVNKHPNLSELSPTYCYCSVGWVKELFEKATDIEVKVDLLHSVVSGADECRFKIQF